MDTIISDLDYLNNFLINLPVSTFLPWSQTL